MDRMAQVALHRKLHNNEQVHRHLTKLGAHLSQQVVSPPALKALDANSEHSPGPDPQFAFAHASAASASNAETVPKYFKIVINKTKRMDRMAQVALHRKLHNNI